MSTALVIATRELRERSRLFIVAAALAMIPFVVAMVSDDGRRGELIRMVGAAAAVSYAFAIALAMGASAIGRDLSEKRLSFYFSKPISPAALWIGKASASLLIALLCALIVALPSTLLTSASKSTWTPDVSTVALFVLLVSVTFFFGGHAVSTMTRSRSILVLLDFILAAAMLLLAAWILRPIVVAGGGKMAGGLASAMFVGLLLILALAPVWQLGRGRTDVRRSHAALSKALWAGVAVLLLLAGAFTVWLRSVAPSDLIEVREFEQAPSGGWAMVSGVTAHRADFHSAFLMNTKTGEETRLAAPPWSDVAWSRDGRVAVWMQPVGLRLREFELHVWEAGAGKVRPTGIFGPFWNGVVLSDDGSRVAVAKSDAVTVYDLQHDRLLVSARIENGSRAQLFFPSRDVVRVLQYDSSRTNTEAGVRSYELDIPKRSISRLGEREKAGIRTISYAADGSRAFMRTTGEIVDGRTLTPIVKVSNGSRSASMLQDGHVAVIEKDAAGVRVRMFDREGRALHVIALPNVNGAFFVAETTDGKLLLSAGNAADRSMLVVDWTRGVVERTVPHVTGRAAGWRTDPRIPRYEAGQPIVGVDSTRKLKVWS